ncbi:ATP-grasp domain-containing protein [Streptomyces melanogenes]|uniref:ATP-grasp domain-containing protein n=1 Tax=Streptomyces melanogenes TaxID=67326 RepID=UPI00167D406E|nr:ATP-grasp domain-containing protein [Streptomyces melanogenes]GGP95391.1 argininosuccinate lyase [Streptomyces melanogenes]
MFSDRTCPDTPLLVVLGAGDRVYYGYALQHIAARYPVALLDEKPGEWACDVSAATVEVDLAADEDVFRAVGAIAADRGVAGVLTYQDQHVELAARLADFFRVPGNTPSSATACRDQHLAQSLLTAADILSITPALAGDAGAGADAAVEHASALGGPVVLKPRILSGHAGGHRARHSREAREAFVTVRNPYQPGGQCAGTGGVLIEAYIDGPEIGVECVVLDPDTVHVAAVSRTFTRDQPSARESGHLVDAADPVLRDPRIGRLAASAVAAVGLSRGVVHVQMRLTHQGPRITEIGATLAGDLIPHLVHLATGLNLPQIAADLATDADPDLVPSQSRCAAVRFLYPSVTGHVTAVHCGIQAAWLERLVWTALPGEHVCASPNTSIRDRTALAVVTGGDPSSCRKRLQLVEERTGIHIQAGTA